MQRIARGSLRFILVAVVVSATCLGQATKPGDQAVQTQNSTAQPDASSQRLSPESLAKLTDKVRHELVMLPYYTVFDNLYFRIDGRTVTLMGQTTNPTNKSSAENAVKHIEGVDKVVNQIEVLPPSPADDRIRRAAYQSIYSYGPLFKYSHGTLPPIHIIVKNGRITLDGVVDSESDKQVAGMRANQVPGTFAVTNNLRVISPTSSKKKE